MSLCRSIYHYVALASDVSHNYNHCVWFSTRLVGHVPSAHSWINPHARVARCAARRDLRTIQCRICTSRTRQKPRDSSRRNSPDCSTSRLDERTQHTGLQNHSKYTRFTPVGQTLKVPNRMTASTKLYSRKRSMDQWKVKTTNI